MFQKIAASLLLAFCLAGNAYAADAKTEFHILYSGEMQGQLRPILL